MIYGSSASPCLLHLIAVTKWNFWIAELNISILLFPFAVRAGTGGDEAGIWAGDLVGTHAFILFVLSNPCRVHEEQCHTHTNSVIGQFPNHLTVSKLYFLSFRCILFYCSSLNVL